MLFYNDFEIQQARDRYRYHPVLGSATALLYAVACDANSYSDGWCHWAVPVRACKQLITLIESGNATPEQFRKAQGPIKAFYTKVRAGKYGSLGSYPTFPVIS